MPVQGLGHVVIYVGDLERSVRFYRDVLGWPPAYTGDEPLPYRAMAFTTGSTHHELLIREPLQSDGPIEPGRNAGMHHFGVKVGDSDDELRDMHARLIANDVPIVAVTDHGFTHSVYILDPDGNKIELYIDVANQDWTDPLLWSEPSNRQLQL